MITSLYNSVIYNVSYLKLSNRNPFNTLYLLAPPFFAIKVRKIPLDHLPRYMRDQTKTALCCLIIRLQDLDDVLFRNLPRVVADQADSPNRSLCQSRDLIFRNIVIAQII